MELIKPQIECLTVTDNALMRIEEAGRTCYKSEDKIGTTACPPCEGGGHVKNIVNASVPCSRCQGSGQVPSSELFVEKILESGHLSVIEHAYASYRIICDRGVTHEIVRHRLVSYSQESTRYCNYKGGVTFVIPPWLHLEEGHYDKARMGQLPSGPGCQEERYWLFRRLDNEIEYQQWIKWGWSPQKARGCLPNCLKTEIVMTTNLREWAHFLKLRTTNAAHPQMREVAYKILADIKSRVPIIFDDIR